MRLDSIFRKNKMKKKKPLPKINLLLQIGGEIEAPLCSVDFIQILLKLTWIEKFTIQAYFRRIYMQSLEHKLIFGK